MDTKHESSDVAEDIDPISMMVTDDSNGNTNKRDLDTNSTLHERPMRKPKVELRLPEGVNEKKEEVVSPLSKQFWKAADYESCGNNSETVVPPGGMDHLRAHPRFLHSNATSHKWALGAFAELLDNSLDEVRTGATYVKVDMLNNEKDTCSKMLLIEGVLLIQVMSLFITSNLCLETILMLWLMADNGGGMTPDKMRGCMSLSYFEKRKLANSIGQCE
ncbi:hypothetical protein Tco_1272017, partial [Tanacetum coccineum]